MSGLRAGARLAAIGVLLLLCLPGHSLAGVMRRRSPWPRRFLAGVARTCGARVRVTGTPPGPATLLLANHRSWLDIPVLAGATAASFVSKAEVARWPLVGALARMHGTLFVERARRTAVADQADAVRNALAAGRLIALFPEGTIHHGPGLAPFRPALLAAVAPPPPGVAVRPVRIDYGAAEALVAWPEGEGAWANMRRILRHRGGFTVQVAILPALAPADDRKTLAEAARGAIAHPFAPSGVEGPA